MTTVVNESYTHGEAGKPTVWTITGQKRVMYHWYCYTQTVSRYAKATSSSIPADNFHWEIHTEISKTDSAPLPPMLDHFTTLPEELDQPLYDALA